MATPESDGTTRKRIPQTSSRSTNGKTDFSVEMILTVLRRTWKTVVPAGLILGVLAAAGFYLTFTPHYQAKVLVWIAASDPYLVDPTIQLDQNFVNNQLGLIRSALVLGPTISRPEIARLPELQNEEPIESLRMAVDVTKAWGAEHYFILATSKNPADAATIANAVTASYFSLVGEYQAGRDKRLIELLDREKDSTEREVERLRENVRQLTIEQTGKDPFAAGDLATDTNRRFPLANVQSQLTSMRVEQAVLRSQITALDEFVTKNPGSVPDVEIERALEGNEQVRQFRGRLASRNALIQDVLTKSAEGEKSPRLPKLRADQQADEEAFAKFMKGLYESTKDQLGRDLLKQHASRLADLKNRFMENASREAVLTREYEEEVGKIKRFSGETLALDIKRNELARAQSVLDRIAQRAFMLRTEQRAPTRVEMLEKANIPIRPLEDLPYKKILLAFGAAFVSPLALAVLWELRHRRISTAEQLLEKSSIPVVGEVANLPMSAATQRYFGVQRAGRQVKLFEESVESLRICLFMTKNMQDTQVIALCSAASQEGKTTLSTQLAISMARSADGLTLLIDGDMRAPDIHSIFEVENSRGMVEVLQHACTSDDAIVSSWDERLHILPAGKLKGRPHELVRGGEFGALIERLREKYRYIIIDTPPVLPAGESVVMAAAADVTLLCTRRDVSRQDQVRKAYDRLVSAGVQVAGCVFSGIPLSRYKYRYGGYYYGEHKKR